MFHRAQPEAQTSRDLKRAPVKVDFLAHAQRNAALEGKIHLVPGEVYSSDEGRLEKELWFFINRGPIDFVRELIKIDHRKPWDKGEVEFSLILSEGRL